MELIADFSKVLVIPFFIDHPEYIISICSAAVVIDREPSVTINKQGIYKTYEGSIVYWDGVTNIKQFTKNKKISLSSTRYLTYLTEEGHQALKNYVVDQLI